MSTRISLISACYQISSCSFIHITMEPFSAHSVFALNMYNTYAMANQGQNLLLSPISIFAALSMVLPGAKDNTLNQMLQVMHLNSSLPMNVMEASLGQMLKFALGDGTNGSDLLSANRAYVDSGFSLRPEYLKALRDLMNTEILSADFSKNPETERMRINDWVSQMTKGKISNALQSGSIDHMTRLILANALYFKRDWEIKFEKSKTRQQQFHLTPESSNTVEMMERKGHWNVTRIPDLPLTIVHLPFKKPSGLSMLAILPTEKHQLDSVMSAMRAEDWLRVLGAQTQSVRAIVRLPKTRLEMGANLESHEYLPSLGMTDMFGSGANFGRMYSGGETLSVSSIVHKAVLEWDEVGAEGAAVTLVSAMITSVIEEPVYEEIFFNQPFLAVVVKEVSTGAGIPNRIPIFVARISNPK